MERTKLTGTFGRQTADGLPTRQSDRFSEAARRPSITPLGLPQGLNRRFLARLPERGGSVYPALSETLSDGLLERRFRRLVAILAVLQGFDLIGKHLQHQLCRITSNLAFRVRAEVTARSNLSALVKTAFRSSTHNG
jgi:hypothetical protein